MASKGKTKNRPRTSQTRPKPNAAAPPEPEPDLHEALAEARRTTLRMVEGVDGQREQLTELLRSFLNAERRLTQPEQDVKVLLEGIADAVDELDRWAGDEAADPALHRERLRSASGRLEKLVGRTGRAELIGRVGETADAATHKWREVKDVPGAAADTVLEVWERGVRYRGELLRTAVVVTASGEGATE